VTFVCSMLGLCNFIVQQSVCACRPFHLGLTMTNLGLHYMFLDICDWFYSAIKRLSILCYIKSVCSLSILTCLAFSSPRFIVPYFPFLHFHVLHFCATFSSLAFSSPAVLCRIFHSCIFQPCIFLCAAFSCLAFSVAPWGRCPKVARSGILLCRRCTQPKGTLHTYIHLIRSNQSI